MVAVLDPDAQSGILKGYFTWSSEDDSAYLIVDGGALPVGGVRGLTELDDAQLSRIGSDWFIYDDNAEMVYFERPDVPIVVGGNGFDGSISGIYNSANKAVFVDLIAGFSQAQKMPIKVSLMRLLAANPGKHALFDFTDLSTMRQTSTGTGAVIASDPVGLILDQSQWGGKTLEQVLAGQPELVTNGGFDDASGWTLDAGWVISGGKAQASAGVSDTISQSGILTDGAWYHLTYTVSGWEADGVLPLVGVQGVGPTVSADGTYSEIIRCKGNTALYFLKGAAFVGAIDNVSVREVPGNHLTQATAASRPTATNGLTFDGSNDFMSLPFPGGAGTSDMTVLVAVRTSGDNAFAVMSGEISGRQMWAAVNGQTNTTFMSLVGSPETYINDVQFINGVNTRGEVWTAISDGSWKLLEVRGAAIPGWPFIALGTLYSDVGTGYWDLAGSILSPVIIDNTALSPSEQVQALSLAQQYLQQQIASLS